MQATNRGENVNIPLASTDDTYRYNLSQESELANYNLVVISTLMVYRGANPEVGIPQFEAQSASCATSARAEVAKRFNKLFLAIAQVALRFKENKSFLHFIALRTENIYNSVRIIALRTEKNLVACALLRCAL